MMESPNKPSEGDAGFDEPDAVVGMVGGGGVVEHQEHPGDQLDSKNKEHHASEDVDPARPSRDGLIQGMMDQRRKMEAFIQKMIDSFQHRDLTCIRFQFS